MQKQALIKSKTEEERRMAKASVPALVAYIVRTQGLGGLYKGLSMELFRGVLSGAVRATLGCPPPAPHRVRPCGHVSAWRPPARRGRCRCSCASRVTCWRRASS